MTEAIGERQPAQDPIHGQSVLAYFMQQQAKNPNYIDSLASRLFEQWEQMPASEQQLVGIIEQHYFPNNLAERERSTKALLLSQYIGNQITLAASLNRTFEAS